MAVSLAPEAHIQFSDATGAPLASGKVFTFAAGTSTPLATFTDSTGGTPNANPIILDAGGFANIWLTSNVGYKIQVQNAAGVTQWTVDNVLNTIFVGVSPQKQIFTAGGTFTIPAGVTSVKVTVVGAGGGGGGSDAGATFNGAGGGSGGCGIKWLTSLTPGNTLTVALGTGGTVTPGAAGGNGGGSSVTSGTQVITSILTNGGFGGGSAAGTLVGGAAAAAGTGGDTNDAGTPAANAAPIATMSNWGGPGASSILGGGGGTVFAGAGAAGTAAGSGGGGAGGGAARVGGVGAGGRVIFEWVA